MRKLLLLIALIIVPVSTFAAEKAEIEYYKKGLSFALKGQFEEAHKEFEAGLNTDYPYSSPLLAAREMTKRAINQEIKKEAALSFFRGTDYANRGQIDKAIREFSRAIKVEPGCSPAYNSRGIIYMLRGQHEKALADFNQIIARDPSYAKAYMNRANVYLKKGSLPEALSEMNQALRLNPRYAEAYYRRGLLYYSMEKYDQAIIDLTKAISLYSKFEGAYYKRGMTYALKGLNNEALADLNQALVLNPKNLLAAFYKATMLEKMGARKEAIKSYVAFLQGSQASPDYTMYTNLIEMANEAINRLSDYDE